MPIATSSDLIELSSENKTEELANKIIKKLKISDIIFLYGEMGVGKTTFARFLINGLQKKERSKLTEVTSPTFNLLHEYDLNILKINHYDLFRIKTTKELSNLDLFSDRKSSITIVEWPQLIKEKPKNLIELNFKYGPENTKRIVQIKGLDL
tara:strand:- start:5990 stop:6445 length:456 start_codon:yes stop_codon:yes gene_type:complete